MTLPDAGLVASKVAPVADGAHAPSMYMVVDAPVGRSGAAGEIAAVDFGGTGAPGRTLVGLLHPRRPDLPGAATVCPSGRSARNSGAQLAGAMMKGARWAPFELDEWSGVDGAAGYSAGISAWIASRSTPWARRQKRATTYSTAAAP